MWYLLHSCAIKTGRWSSAAFALALVCFFSGESNAQQRPNDVIIAPGNAAVTGFSGALAPIQIAPGVDPGEQTFIDLDGPSLRVVDLHHMGGPPTAQLVGAPKPFTFTAAQIGQVFGVALDDNSPPNIYVAATSSYGLPIVTPGADGPRHIKSGASNATFAPGLWGPQGGPGSIWKIDGATGRVTLFANVSLDGRSNSGPALGGLAYDPPSKTFFVADRESGLIFHLALDGRILDHYDHGVTGRQAQGLPPVPWNSQQPIDITSPRFDSTDPASWNYAAPKRRVFGLAVHERRLYYAVADGLQIWSVGLNSDGSFSGDAVIELAVPPSSGPTEVSKIAFDEQDRMFLAERPAPTGAFDFEALSVPAIGRVLRYPQIGRTPDGRRIWQEAPDQYAIGFPRDFRNGNGGVAIGYNYDHNGEFILSSCGGFMWITGEDLRDSSDATVSMRLGQSGPLHLTGLQGNGTWRVERNSEPPLQSYFIDYSDEVPDEAARGQMGDIAIARLCALRAQILPPSPPQPGAPPIRQRGTPPGGGAPPATPPGLPPSVPGTPPGSCPPSQVRNVITGSCGSCPRPNIQINGKCCPVASLAANAACSNSNCPSGQTAIGPSNFCCNSGQVFTNPRGAQACCSGQVVNGQCPTPPITSNCPAGYTFIGGSCCLTSQMTSTGMCCPAGQTPSGPNKSQCVPYIPIHLPPPQCCPAGQIPTAGPKSCCAAANVTTTGLCCPQPVDPNDRTHCPAQIQFVPACAAGYAKMPDGSCCNNRFVSADGRACNPGGRPCAPGEFREPNGACVPIPSNICPPGEVRTLEGGCRPFPFTSGPCPPGQFHDRSGHCVQLPSAACPPGEVRNDRGECVPIKALGCPPGEVRNDRSECLPIEKPGCPPGTVSNRRGECAPIEVPGCPPGEVRNRRGVCVRVQPPPSVVVPPPAQGPRLPVPAPHGPIPRGSPGQPPFGREQ